MTPTALLDRLRPTGLDGLAFPRHLLGAFRRKSITFCTGVTDETTVVYWFQSRGFTIDLRLPDGASTPVAERQGWVADTLWDDATRQMSWRIARSYQPRDQWPEPAVLRFIGNSVLEFAPSGAYVEDWRQMASQGPFLGLRLLGGVDDATGHRTALDGGLVIAGDHIACARSRLPRIDAALHDAASLERALATGIATEAEVESYEVSVAVGGMRITHSTRADRRGEAIDWGDFTVRPDGLVARAGFVGGEACVLLYAVDMFDPDFAFAMETPTTPDAHAWMEREKSHLAKNAVIVR